MKPLEGKVHSKMPTFLPKISTTGETGKKNYWGSGFLASLLKSNSKSTHKKVSKTDEFTVGQAESHRMY